MTTPEREKAIHAQLMAMSIGGTSVIFDRVVTRWSKDSFETNTFGKAYFSAESTAYAIAIATETD